MDFAVDAQKVLDGLELVVMAAKEGMQSPLYV